ncbi:replication initiator protein A [Anaerotruncus colihominis]|uniref:replication initiator protein A n=1 Tax=Anaerotruncus colihominis TaxID=169435 RepID=UPI003F8A1C03
MRTITEYITADTIMPPFFRYPRFLLKMDLSQTAKLLYSLLLDRSELSQKNGWQDSEGRTYIVYPVSEIAEMLDKGSTAIKAALNELDAAGLLVRERRGFSAPNRLYVKVPQVPVVQFSDHMTAIQSENRPSDSRKSDPHKDGKPTPNQLTINKLKENQLKGASEKPPAPFGRYQNVLLSESEYAELKEEYPDRLERLIEEMSEFIAATGNDYVCHAAALRRWLNREKKENPKKGIPDYSYKEGESL